jgi:CRP/FNR family transcriptional regulator, cyclic AMP receptor protein
MMAWPRDLDVFCSAGWLSETSEQFKDAVLSRCIVREYKRNDSVYRTGDDAGGLFGLVSGGVAVEVTPEDRDPYLGLFARPGFWIGEYTLITRRPRVIGLRVTVDSVLAHLPLSQWDSIVAADPAAWRWLALLPLRNEMKLFAIADALLVPRAPARVAAMLLVLASAEQHTATPAETEIEIGHEEIARITNLSRSSVGRILDDFAQRGLIAYRYRRLRIISLSGLQAARSSQ